MKISVEQFESDLRNYYGTEAYHHYSPTLFPNIVLTDGAKYVAETAGAYWLMDMFASHLAVYSDRFAVGMFQREGVAPYRCKFTLDDGNLNVKLTQGFEYSDFPLDTFKLYAVRQEFPEPHGMCWVIMLPGEYRNVTR